MRRVFKKERNVTGRREALCLIAEIVVLSFCMFFSEGFQGSKEEITIGVIICVASVVLLGGYAFVEIEFHKFAFLFVLITGGLSVFIQPILNIPDEYVHFDRAELVSNGIIIMDTDQLEFDTIQASVDLYNELKGTYIQSDLKGKEIDYSPASISHVAASNLAFLYFPQALGIRLAKLLHLNVIWLLWLGRFGNLLCYAILTSLAIKIAPRWKFPLFFAAALPMSVQQAASCSPDAIINGAAFVLIGYFLYLYCGGHEKVTWKEIIIIFLLGIIVTLSKVTNIFLAGLILLIPKEKFSDGKKAALIKASVIGMTVIVGGAYYFYTTSFPTPPEHAVYFEIAGVDSNEQVQYILGNWMEWLVRFCVSLIKQVKHSVETLNTFGWLEYGCSVLNWIFVIELGKICIQEKGLHIKNFNKFLILLMVCGSFSAACLALYITWTPVGAGDIWGLQGRYFIPAIALFTLLFASGEDNGNGRKNYVVDMTVITGMVGIMLMITTMRYY